MPKDGQDILIATSWGVSQDLCMADCDEVGNNMYCYGYIDKMTDELLPECKECRSHTSKAQDDLDAWLQQPPKGE